MKKHYVFLLLSCIVLGACTSDAPVKQNVPEDQDEKRKFNFGSLAGEEGIQFGAASKKNTNPNNLHINIFLWRAALDSLNFAPIAVSDNIGGIITTEWYSPNNGTERFKINARITSKELRADALTLKLFKQVLKNGAWHDVHNIQQQQNDLELIILKRARELYIQNKK
jgi:hypothetical protein